MVKFGLIGGIGTVVDGKLPIKNEYIGSFFYLNSISSANKFLGNIERLRDMNYQFHVFTY